jgi:diguanylate cyclase (GGDEF)-like protein
MKSPEKQISAPEADSSLPDVLRKSADGWFRTQSATMALLKHAYSQIGASEKRIAEQDKRIRELEDLAATDPLTGLMNRRGFEKFFDHELARIHRKHSPGAMFALIDLDLFKHVNDTHGHLAGDACLELVSKKLLQSIRMLDGAARLGGDEFVLLLTQIEPENAAIRLEKIREAINDLTLVWKGQKIHFGASIGIALVRENSTYTNIYQAADKSLYADKEQRKQGAIRKT